MMLSINEKLIFLVLLSFAAILSGKAYCLIQLINLCPISGNYLSHNNFICIFFDIFCILVTLACGATTGCPVTRVYCTEPWGSWGCSSGQTWNKLTCLCQDINKFCPAEVYLDCGWFEDWNPLTCQCEP